MATSLIPFDENGVAVPPIEEDPTDVDFEIEDAFEEDEETRKRAMQAMYGPAFPLLKDEPLDADWVVWAQQLWQSRQTSVASRLHEVERNRMFRKGMQWISSIGLGPWRTPPGPKDAVRYVHNMFDDALDQRHEILIEQRPGFSTKPTRQDPDSIKKAEGQQLALEYQYDEQGMQAVLGEMGYWVGTDGVCFAYTFWDPDKGPWHEAHAKAGKAIGFNLGDPRSRVYRIEQVRVSPNATATEQPYWWVLREEIPLGQAVAEHGVQVVAEVNAGPVSDAGYSDTLRDVRDRYGTSTDEDMFGEDETTDRLIVLVPSSEFLPEGLMLVVVGNAVVYQPSALLPAPNVAPVWRMTDGSTDPSFYPEPKCNQWTNPQMAVNAALSKWIESVRRNAGGQLITRAGAVSVDTLVAGLMNIIEVTGAGGPLTNDIQVLPGFAIGQDVIQLLQVLIKAFEDASGWNDTSRGSFAASASGRSILAQREALEKIFAPGVNAAADAMSGGWAKITLHWMKWGYDLPRLITLTGNGRPDIAREMSSEDFDGVADVEIDPETLMPMPRALRLFLLDSMLEKGIISAQEYRRRIPFAFVKSIDTPDRDHTARAKRVVDAIQRMAEGDPTVQQVPPILWQDNEAIHQDVLERELILNDDALPLARDWANQRWMQLAQQATMKMGGMPLGAPPAPAPSGGGGSSAMPARSQPMLSMRPSVAAGPIAGSDQQAAGASFDRMSPQ